MDKPAKHKESKGRKSSSVNLDEIKIDGAVHAKQNHKLDNSKTEVQ